MTITSWTQLAQSCKFTVTKNSINQEKDAKMIDFNSFHEISIHCSEIKICGQENNANMMFQIYLKGSGGIMVI